MKSQHLGVYLASCLIAVALTGCGREDAAHSSASADEQAAAAKATELEAREQQLAQREAEVQAKEAEQEAARRAEAEAAEREAAKVAAAKQAADEAAARRAATKAATKKTPATGTSPVRNTTPPAATPVPAPLEVQAGTQLSLALASEVTTKTAKVGDRFEARLTAPLQSGDRLVAPAGARVSGTVTEVVSGSKQIGAVPALGLHFDQLELADGRQVAIRGELQQLGKSEKGTDAAKIIGGAAAGAVIGHQIKHGTKGQVIGGILGGAAGAVVAKNTGAEVQLPAGSELTIALEQGFVVTPAPN